MFTTWCTTNLCTWIVSAIFAADIPSIIAYDQAIYLWNVCGRRALYGSRAGDKAPKTQFREWGKLHPHLSSPHGEDFAGETCQEPH